MTTISAFIALFVYLTLFGNYNCETTTLSVPKVVCGRAPYPPHVPWIVTVQLPVPDDDSPLGITTSGVIVSSRVVLTYARDDHTIFTQNITKFKVLAGNTKWIDATGDTEQRRNVSHRFLITNPSDSNDQNVAVLIVEPPFEFDSEHVEHVAPVCLNFSADVSNADLVGEIGTLAAYRYAWRGGITLQSYTVLNNTECVSTHEDAELELNLGKFCARIPATVGKGPTCAMVEGGGLFVHKTVNDEQAAYLIGLARMSFSLAKGDDRCNDEEYQLFVNVNQYKNEIQKYIADYQ